MATTYVQNLRRLSRDVRLYFLTNGMVGLCRMGVYSVVLDLYLLRLGSDPEFIGLVNATRSVSYAVFSLPAGALAALGLALSNGFMPTEWRALWLLAACLKGWKLCPRAGGR